jgi:HD-GYP domain-containing protein (c-di-GMP phosphodiesterase class II)
MKFIMNNYIQIFDKQKKLLISISFILTILVSILVYLTGGTIQVYANLMYIPIALTALTASIKFSILHAIFSGLLLGPFMPLNVNDSIMQQPMNWLFRLAIYTIVSLAIAYFAKLSERKTELLVLKEKEISDAQLSMVFSLIKVSEARDDDTGTHIDRISEYCKVLASELGKNDKYKAYINDSYVDAIRKASSLHDIGKVGIPDRILLKPGKLTADEFEVMKTHTILGEHTLLEVKKQYSNNPLIDLGLSIAKSHHEKWDGSGYPMGLAGEDIPLSARIMAVADVYDALRSRRIYKDAFSHEKCVRIIKENSGTHFDPEIVEVFILNESAFDNIFNNYSKLLTFNIFKRDYLINLSDQNNEFNNDSEIEY